MKTIRVNESVYHVIRLLGKGKSGYSYLVGDDAGLYVIKQIHHEPCEYYCFGDKLRSETEDYARLRALNIRIPVMLDVDVNRERILKEYIEGETICDYVKKDRMEPGFMDQMRDMCAILYAAQINIDYFPTNFVVRNGLLYYIDYECNLYSDEWNFENWGSKYWSNTPEFCEYIEKNNPSAKENHSV